MTLLESVASYQHHATSVTVIRADGGIDHWPGCTLDEHTHCRLTITRNNALDVAREYEPGTWRDAWVTDDRDGHTLYQFAHAS